MKLKDLEKTITYKIFLDLDGVLAAFVKGVKKLYPEFKDGDLRCKKQMWDAVDKYGKEGGQLWAELDLTDDAMLLWDYVKDIKDIEGTEILTATGNSKHGAGPQKLKWVKEHFGNVKVNLVRASKKKAEYAKPNHILIDDMERSINPWVEAGGIGILHTSAKDTIKKLKELGL